MDDQAKQILKETAIGIVFPAYYALGKFLGVDFSLDDSRYFLEEQIMSAVCGIALHAGIGAGIYGIGDAYAQNENYVFENHTISVQSEKTYDKNNERTGFIIPRIIGGMLTPWSPIIDILAKDTYTVFDDYYKVKGEDIVEYSPTQGYSINEVAFTQRDFYIENEKYNQNELEEELNNMYKEYKDLQEDLAKNANTGKSVENMKLNSEYYLAIKEKEKDLEHLMGQKTQLVDDLLKIAKDLNEEMYNMRNHVKKKYNDLEQQNDTN